MLAATLLHLGFSPDSFVLADDGAGPYIAAWYSAQPQPTPEQIEAARKPAALALVTERIKEKRDEVKRSGCNVGGARFHSDDTSLLEQLGLFIMGANVPPVPWKTMSKDAEGNPVFVPMSQTLAAQLFAAQAQRKMTTHAVAEQHIAAAALLDDPLTHDYSTGWPE